MEDRTKSCLKSIKEFVIDLFFTVVNTILYGVLCFISIYIFDEQYEQFDLYAFILIAIVYVAARLVLKMEPLTYVHEHTHKWFANKAGYDAKVFFKEEYKDERGRLKTRDYCLVDGDMEIREFRRIVTGPLVVINILMVIVLAIPYIYFTEIILIIYLIFKLIGTRNDIRDFIVSFKASNQGKLVQVNDHRQIVYIVR